MPKKTKRDKIIAEYRRKLLSVSDRSKETERIKNERSDQSSFTISPAFSLKQQVPKNEPHDVLSLDPQEFIAIKKDLIMTLGLTGVILIGQIVVWRVVG